MAVFWVIFDRREQTGKQQASQKFENAEIAQQKTAKVETDAAFSGQLEDACVIKLEGASLTTAKEASQAAQHFYPGLFSGPPVVVTNANFKENP